MAVQLAVVVVSGHIDVATTSPAASPAVLDHELLAVESYHRHGMVSTSSASGVLEDSSPVLFALAGHFKGYCDWSSS